MGYVLLWVFMLGAALSWLAAALATGSYVPHGGARRSLRVVLSLIPTAAMGGLVWLAWYARDRGYIHFADAAVVYVMALLFAGGAVWMLTRSWWRRKPRSSSAKASTAESAAAKAAGAVASAPTWDEAKGSQPPAGTEPTEPTEPTEQGRAPQAGPGLRLRTVMALWGLAVMCVGLHLVTLWLLRGVAAGAVDADLQTVAKAEQADIDQEKKTWPPLPAAGPADAVAAYNAFENDPNPAEANRRMAMEYRLSIFIEKMRSEHKPLATWHVKLADSNLQTFVAAEDNIDETLPQTVARLRAQIEALRACTRVLPLWRGLSARTPHLPIPDDPIMRLQWYTNIFIMDAEAAQATGDWARAEADLDAMANLARQARDQPGGIGTLVWIACRGIRWGAARRLLGAPDLPRAALEGWSKRHEPVMQAQLPARLDGMVCGDLSPLKDCQGAGAAPRYFGLNPSGYVGRLFWVYFPPDVAADYLAVLPWLRKRLAAPYWQADPLWPTASDRSTLGYQGLDAITGERSLLQSAVRVDEGEDLLDVGRAARLYQFKYGKWPADLPTLVPAFMPAVPVDRFDGKPLKMRNDGTGMVIWSAGAFDNGDERSGDGRPQTNDLGDSDLVLWLGSDYTAREKARVAQHKQ
ncbi:MAG: hypothetical protein ACREJ2_11770 [Planctomycetota bacterium]